MEAPAKAPSLPREARLSLYEYLKANRALEERLSAFYRQGKITGGFYRSLGQEAISVGSAFALEAGDVLAPMIRNLGSLLVRGMGVSDIFANYLARGDGPTGGKDNVVHFGTVDGSGHFQIDERGGLVSCISALGNLVGVLAGIALAARLQRRRIVCLTYVGDGASSTGEFHEGMNFAAAQKLPLVVIIENNGFAYSTPVSRQTNLKDLADRARLYGCPGVVVDGQDVEQVHAVTKVAVDRARAGEGPALIEAKTFRIKGHAEHDDQSYVPAGLIEQWAKRDPLVLYGNRLIEEGAATSEQLSAIDEGVIAAIERAAAAALELALPTSDVVMRDVYNEPEMNGWVGDFKR